MFCVSEDLVNASAFSYFIPTTLLLPLFFVTTQHVHRFFFFAFFYGFYYCLVTHDDRVAHHGTSKQ
ncbi:hypothetical protein DFP73DRAFT_556052 [Morchella snyderi]|nr:hypothetical protein DFP73DRAFT_556052 [Morchella snyderi]